MLLPIYIYKAVCVWVCQTGKICKKPKPGWARSLNRDQLTILPVSYTHLTLPTKRIV